MSNHKNFFFLVSFFFIGFVSCSTNSDNSNGENDLVDSIEIETSENDLISEQAPVSPQLIGKWKLIETRRMDGENIPSIGGSTLTFTENHEIISASDDFPAETYEFFEENGEINSDLWDSRQKITNLDQTELILSETVDGEDVHYVYQKIMK